MSANGAGKTLRVSVGWSLPWVRGTATTGGDSLLFAFCSFAKRDEILLGHGQDRASAKVLQRLDASRGHGADLVPPCFTLASNRVPRSSLGVRNDGFMCDFMCVVVCKQTR